MSVPLAWDNVLIEYVKTVMNELGLDTFFETGTYQGQTSLYFANQGYNVITVEIDKNTYLNNLEKFKEKNIKSFNMSSEILLAFYVALVDASKTFFYLDAHGCSARQNDSHGPLQLELTYLFKLPRFIILIHDVTWRKDDSCPYKVNTANYAPEVQEDFEKTFLPDGIDVIYPIYKYSGCAYTILSKGYNVIKRNGFTYDKTGDSDK